MFKKSSDRVKEARAVRENIATKNCKMGISFLDKAFRGIFRDDVVLLSASSGAGKTEAALMIALSNLEDGKKVYFFALEASHAEIENRMLYPHVIERLYADPDRPSLGGLVDYSDWICGFYGDKLDSYTLSAEEFCRNAYRDLHTFYTTKGFTPDNLIEEVTLCSDDADLIIIDHAHFFSFGDKTDTEGLKELVTVIRSLSENHKVPIVLVAHMRKRDRFNSDLVPGMEEIHGSSDLFKVATRVVTLAPGKVTSDGKYETFIRICKNRLDNGASRYMARQIYDPRKRKYELSFEIDWAERGKDEGFQMLSRETWPHWARRG